MKKLTIILLFIIVAALVSLGFKVSDMRSNPKPLACTMEAKLCPDGSAVGRTGPRCEFAKCPEIKNVPKIEPGNEDIVLRIGEKGKMGNLNVALNKFVQDSRCPIDVQCIWAGAVTVNVTLSDSSLTETINLTTNEEPHVFGDYKISITAVTPAPMSQKKILDSEYLITFHIEK